MDVGIFSMHIKHRGQSPQALPCEPVFTMSNSSILITIVFLLPLSLSSSTPALSSLIERTCTATSYHDFCVSALSSSSSSQALNTTTKSLSTAIINLAVANATSTSSFASALAARSATSNPTLASLLRTCAEKYARAKESLVYSLDAMASEDYDYASVHVGAAAEYPKVCRDLFRRRVVAEYPAEYPAEMARREEVTERLCSVALDIISILMAS